MYTEHNTEARSHNQGLHRKAPSITYSECVTVVLVMQHTPHYIIMARLVLHFPH